MSDAIEALHKSRYNCYEFGDKPSKFLAHQLRQTSALNHVTQIYMSSGPTIYPLLFNDFLGISILLCTLKVLLKNCTLKV